MKLTAHRFLFYKSSEDIRYISEPLYVIEIQSPNLHYCYAVLVEYVNRNWYQHPYIIEQMFSESVEDQEDE